MKGDKRHKDGSSLNHRILHNKIQIKPNHKNWRQKKLGKKETKRGKRVGRRKQGCSSRTIKETGRG